MNQKGRENEGSEETRGALCFVCHLLLMRHMWAALETMSHAHNGTVATIGSKQAPSVKDDCVGVCYSAADFSPVIEWLSTICCLLDSPTLVWCTSQCGNSEVCPPWEAHTYRCAPRLYWSVICNHLVSCTVLYRHTHSEKCSQTHQHMQPLPSFHLFLPSLMAFLTFIPAG